MKCGLNHRRAFQCGQFGISGDTISQLPKSKSPLSLVQKKKAHHGAGKNHLKIPHLENSRKGQSITPAPEGQ